MFQESVILRNLKVLESVAKADCSLEEIATQAGYRPRLVERSLHLLAGQGMVERVEDKYRFSGNREQLEQTLGLITPWLNPAQESFYDIARDVARMIVLDSYTKVEVQSVLLYGSTLQSQTPRDIDLVILHRGNKLASFVKPQYAEEGTQALFDVPAGNPINRRLRGFDVFRKLGYNGEKYVVQSIGERIKDLGIGGDVAEKDVKILTKMYGKSVDEKLSAHYDVYGVNELFDVHELHTSLLGDEVAIAKKMEYYDSILGDPIASRDLATKDYAERGKSSVLKGIVTQRESCVTSCRDPWFWHRVLSTGRLYNALEHDFTLSVEDKYPGVLELFTPKGK